MDIQDIRTQFRNTTFSKHQRCAVKKELLTHLGKGNVETACHWGAELVCSGLFMDLWEAILYFFSKYIHVGNPKLSIYLITRFHVFKNIAAMHTDQELTMRNNVKIRKMFSEIISILATSVKRHSYECIQVAKEDFDLFYLNTKLKAPSVEYMKNCFRSGDPKELYIALNEFSYHISIKNAVSACYWLEWLLEFEGICKKKKDSCQGNYRRIADVPSKFQKDMIWIVWEIILSQETTPLVHKLIESALQLFSVAYSPCVKTRRRFLIYYAINLCCEHVSGEGEMIPNKELVEAIVENHEMLYIELKKKEESPKTDYLLHGLKEEKSNRERTMAKLEIMNQYIKN